MQPAITALRTWTGNRSVFGLARIKHGISKPTPSAFADSLTFFGGADRSPLKLLRLRAILFGDELVLTFEYEIPEQET